MNMIEAKLRPFKAAALFFACLIEQQKLMKQNIEYILSSQ
jgi:hypothetical protein